MIRRAVLATLTAIALALSFTPVTPAQAKVITKGVNSSWQCTIPVSWRPDSKAVLSTNWTVKYGKPVTIKPEFWNAWVNNWKGGLDKMTSYDARLILDEKGNEQKIHVSSGADDIVYEWGTGSRQTFYRALDYPVWKVKITTKDGSCTVTNRHVSW